MFKNYFEEDTAKCLIIKTRRKFISVYLLIIKKKARTQRTEHMTIGASLESLPPV